MTTSTPNGDGAISENIGLSDITLSTIANKWVVFTVLALRSGPLRHGELLRRIAGATMPTLTGTLRRLEAAGLVTRTVYPEVPPRVEYALTESGQTLAVPVSALAEWAEANADAFRPTEAIDTDETY